MWDGLIIDGRKVHLVPVSEEDAVGILGRKLEGLFLPEPKPGVRWAEDKVKVRDLHLRKKRHAAAPHSAYCIPYITIFFNGRFQQLIGSASAKGGKQAAEEKGGGDLSPDWLGTLLLF